MKHLLLWTVFCSFAGALSWNAGAQTLRDIRADEIAKLEQEINGDSSLTVKPKKDRRVLVFWRCEGFVHTDSIVIGREAFRLVAEKTKAFQVDFSRDYESLKPENLARYDALVLMNSTSLKTRENPFLARSLISYVKNGKGLTVIHGGADSFNDAPDVSEMIGGHFWGHPWGAGGIWAIHLDEKTNRVNDPFSGDFKQNEEIYQHRPPFYSRAKSRVLLSLDLNDPVTAGVKGQAREDKDYGVSWIKPYGKGRVFYTTFGHHHVAWFTPRTLKHFFRGLQYTIGDLVADDTPAGLSEEDLKRFASSDNQGFVFNGLVDVLTHTYHEGVTKENIRKVGDMLKRGDLNPNARAGVLRALVTIGATADLKGVADSLSVPEARDNAITLLAQTPSAEAADALRQFWGKADAGVRCSLLNAFALRGDSAELAKHINDGDSYVEETALFALGRVGDKTAWNALLAAKKDGKLAKARDFALGAAIGRFLDRDEAKAIEKDAKAIFQETNRTESLRAAAARVLIVRDSDFFQTALKDANPVVREAAISAACKVPEKAIVAALRDCPCPQGKMMLMGIVDRRGIKRAVPELVANLSDSEPDVVCQALRALVYLGGEDELDKIIPLLDKGDPVAPMAAKTLQNMPSKSVGKALFEKAKQNEKLIPILGERQESALLERWKPLLASDQEAIRKAAWKALSKTASEKNIEALTGWLPLLQKEEQQLAVAPILIASRLTDGAKLEQLMEKAWKENASAPARCVLAEVFGSFQTPAFLRLLQDGCADADAGVREAAMNSLSKWPSLDPLPSLYATYGKFEDKETRRATVRAATMLINAVAGKQFDQKAEELFSKIDDSDRLRFADMLLKYRTLESFALFEKMFGNPNYGAAAKKCYVSLYDKNVKGLKDVTTKEAERKNWKATASHHSREASRAFDNNPGTRWDTGTPSVPGMWYTVDFGQNLFITRIEMETKKSANDTPKGCDVFASFDGKEFTGPVAHYDGKTREMAVFTASATARYLKFVTTGTRPGNYWSIHELHIFTGVDQATLDAIGKKANDVR